MDDGWRNEEEPSLDKILTAKNFLEIESVVSIMRTRVSRTAKFQLYRNYV